MRRDDAVARGAPAARSVRASRAGVANATSLGRGPGGSCGCASAEVEQVLGGHDRGVGVARQRETDELPTRPRLFDVEEASSASTGRVLEDRPDHQPFVVSLSWVPV